MFTWLSSADSQNVDQPFVMSGTVIGRVAVPLQVVGNGTNVAVQLCADSGGSPNTTAPLASIVVPAEWLTQLAASDGLENGGPLALASYNTMYPTGGVITNPLSASTDTGTNNVLQPSVACAGNYVIFAGGLQPVAQFGRTVTTLEYAGEGVMNPAVQQPLLPIGTTAGTIGMTDNAAIYAGGVSGTSPGTTTAAVFTASWDVNTGTIGSWSTQAALPAARGNATVATNNDVIYLIGGLDSSSNVTNTVWMASCVNGVISGWVTLSPYPVAMRGAIATVIGNRLIVAGGYNSSAAPISNVYYADILPSGSLGAWNAGPNLVVPQAAAGATAPNWGNVTTPNALVLFSGDDGVSGENPIQVITAGDHGLTQQVSRTLWSAPQELLLFGEFPFGTFANTVVSGAYDAVGIDTYNDVSYATTITPVPVISVPLYATGLTNGATYHLVITQKPIDPNNHVLVGATNGALTKDLLVSTTPSGPWSTWQAGYSAPVTVYDASASGVPWHTWTAPASGDVNSPGSSTLVQDTATDLLIGVCSTTNTLNVALNANPTFTTGVGSWTPHFCTFTQSNAQTHGGFPFSGLMTPTGGNPQAYVISDLSFLGNGAPATGERWLAANGWFYSPTGTSNFSFSVNWYDANQTYLSTDAQTVSLTAATWTNVINTFVIPATAAYAAASPTESGTPTSSNTIYMSNVSLLLSLESITTVANVATVDYDSTTGLPISVTELT